MSEGDLLKKPEAFNIITGEFDKKIVGERETCKVIFLCACGRLVENAQIASYNLLVNSESGSGKDYITSKVLEVLPKDQYIKKTRISPAAFTYWHDAEKEPDWTWDGKVFYCEDISEGVLNSDVFKVMCSSGSSATIVINHQAQEKEIKGKPIIITTTASANPNPEMIRRFVLLQLDESQEQTKWIMRKHSKFAAEGVVPDYNQEIISALDHLKRVKVKVHFADLIDPHFPENNVIMRTNYPRFLDFVKAAAALHQYQRDTDKDGFLLATGQDYDIARACFLKLFSNKYMIPLTRNQKEIIRHFEENTALNGSVSELYDTHGINFISDKALETNLKLLVKYGLLDTRSELREHLHRDVTIYSLNKKYRINEKLSIPTYGQLCRNASTASPASLASFASTASGWGDKEAPEAREALNRPSEAQETPGKGDL